MSRDYHSFWRGSRYGRPPVRRRADDKAVDEQYRRSLAEKGDLVYVHLPPNRSVLIRAEIESGPDEAGEFELRVFAEDRDKVSVERFKSTRAGLIVFSKGKGDLRRQR